MCKTCSKCKIEKDLELFGKNKRKKDGLQDYCRECCKIKDSLFYKKHGNQKHIENNKKIINRNKEFIFRYKNIFGKCIDCGIEDWRVLQFDHISNKKHNISDLTSNGGGLKVIKEEIRKCEIRCANCHQIKTHHNGV